MLGILLYRRFYVRLFLVVGDAVLIPELGWILYTLARRQS
ncbi:hypothetical protein GXM_09238 [Nostoc sphaeroides CCNUC1]|uniref:Uncharacterized protein n=1 Tax=Nostoc sphaeroides CCNUC1 TaxID=2653204 RepID=A0A5P8WGC8_9NOSO|nr:hypothetical protein GXM_09238 [Nostoc sphaeroides CCNUC1]